jgi:hypothetical protein
MSKDYKIISVKEITVRNFPLWKIKVATLMANRRLSYKAAMTEVVIEWMTAGNYKPLAAAIREGRVNPKWLALLADQIESGRLALKRDKGGRPKDPEAKFRNGQVAALYRRDGHLAGIADHLGMSEAAVLKALTAARSNKK